MKLKEITLRGFRGFNEARTIPIHKQLTLMSAPNSHGKTSISEGFEWLLYGFTSKVALAESKDEYRGSYRNIHLLQPEAPTVKIVIQEGAATSELQATLSGSDTVRRVDGKIVPSWPFSQHLEKAPKPFILQHALKDLLLAAPVDRFNRFATLLGFDELTQVHKDLMAFCTKPPLPVAARTLIAEVDALILRVEADSYLAPIIRSLKKGYLQLSATRTLVAKTARSLVPVGAPDKDLLRTLVAQREAAILKIFKGSVSIAVFASDEETALQTEEQALLTSVTSDATTLFGELETHGAQRRILREVQFYELGIELLDAASSFCPFCKQELTGTDIGHIRDEHMRLSANREIAAKFEKAQTSIQKLLVDFNQRISDYYRRIAGRVRGVLDVKGQMAQLRALLTGENEPHATAIARAIDDFEVVHSAFIKSGGVLREAISDVQRVSSDGPLGGIKPVELMGEALIGYITAARALRRAVAAHAELLQAAHRALIQELNKAAGTGTMSLLIELLQNERKIEKRMRIAAAVEGLKDLKADVDGFVTKIMLDTISGELAAAVMEWYGRIRTVGDPDVHFAGFDMKKTAQGGRVQIKASSYGKDLVSAVSSLSESKLNALGLCISIAINMAEPSPFEFLIIDDPIQSWDRDHEIQFISVIRQLVERGKQVVLLSHNGEWVKQVRAACADMNGLYYEITGYTEDGPVIAVLPWVEPKHRLQAILAITEDQQADSIRLQHAEEELRQVLHQYACILYESIKGVPKNPAKLNADKVRKILTECGLSLDLVNRVMTIFETLDDAHHAAPHYSPNRQKLRAYYDIAVQLSQAVNAKLTESKKISIVTPGKTA